MTREEAISLLTQVNKILVNSNSWLENTHELLNMAFDMAIKALEQEPRKGHWIKYDKEYFTPKRLTPVIHSIRECSECHTKIADFCGEMKYCPNCAAKMEGEVKE